MLGIKSGRQPQLDNACYSIRGGRRIFYELNIRTSSIAEACSYAPAFDFTVLSDLNPQTILTGFLGRLRQYADSEPFILRHNNPGYFTGTTLGHNFISLRLSGPLDEALSRVPRRGLPRLFSARLVQLSACLR